MGLPLRFLAKIVRFVVRYAHTAQRRASEKVVFYPERCMMRLTSLASIPTRTQDPPEADSAGPFIVPSIGSTQTTSFIKVISNNCVNSTRTTGILHRFIFLRALTVRTT